MKKKKLILSLVAAITPVLSGCYTVQPLTFKCIAPKGVLSLPLITYAHDYTNVYISNQVNSVASAFKSDEYDIILYDLFEGIRMIQEGNAPFKLARIVTLGNAFIVSTGHDDNNELEDSDFIVSYGRGLMADKIYTKLHPEAPIDYYYENDYEATSAICLGQSLGRNVDYVIISEPYITTTFKNETCATYQKASIYSDLKEEFIDYTSKTGGSLRGFPQDGLFISERLENNNKKKSAIKNFFQTVDEDLRALERSGATSTSEILLRFGSETDQMNRFGIISSILSELQYDKKSKKVLNKLGYNSFEINLDNYANTYAYALDIVIPISTTYSKYYKGTKSK